MEQLTVIVGLLLATVVAVGLGDRLRLPYPVLMLLLAAALTFIPGFPPLDFPPELILPIFLPPLLFATAQRSSWSVFRLRWRTLILLAVALVVVTTATVAGAAWLLIPGIGLPAAIALGAMVAPPDPVAVESVSGRVRMPRRLTTVLQSEGLFNDAAAIVIFQAAVAATLDGSPVGPDIVLQFVLGAAIAVLVGVLMGWFTAVITKIVTSMVARSAVTLVVPFGAYILAEELHASGVIAVVVTALELQRHSRAQDAAERLTRAAFWDVVELLVTGLAFGLMGLEIREVVQGQGADIVPMIGVAVLVCVLVVLVRFLWIGLLALSSRAGLHLFQATSFREVLILTWCGMRGLATLALALSLPLALDDGTDFPARDYLVVISCAVLLTTLVLPGLSLPWLMRVLKASADGSAEDDAVRHLSRRAQDAALAALRQNELIKDLPEDTRKALKARMSRLHTDLAEDNPERERSMAKLKQGRELAIAIQSIALDAARQEVVAARNERGVDPEIADHVLRKLDLRTMLMPGE